MPEPKAQDIYMTLYTICYNVYREDIMETEVLSVRVRKSLKAEAERQGVDLKATLEMILEELVAEKKAKAQRISKELQDLMAVSAKEWANDVKATRHEM